MIDKSLYSKKNINIKSKDEMDREMKRIQALFSNKESEDNWQQFNLALNNIKQWTTSDKIHRYPGFIDHIKLLQKPIISSLTSERTRLASTANELLKELSKAMQRKYELIHDLFAPTLIRLFARTNKVHVKSALTCYKSIIENSKVPRNTKKLCIILRNQKETNKSLRYCVTECLNTIIQVNATADLIKYADDIENAIKFTAMDPAPDVRSSIRMCYKLYGEKIPDNATKFSKSLSTDILKYLQVLPKSRSELLPPTSTLRRNPSSSSLTKREQMKTKASPSSSTSSLSSKSTKSTSGLSSPSLTSLSSASLSSSSVSSLKKTKHSYLSPTSSSSAKINHKSNTTSKLSSLIPLKSSTSLQMKYLGKNPSTPISLKMGYRMKRPTTIKGLPALRVAKNSSENNNDVSMMDKKINNNNNSNNNMKKEEDGHSDDKANTLVINNELDTKLKRSLPDVPLQEEDMNQKKMKVEL
ncbi:unnamed protein product [Cunninghamella blakesleeana]